MGRGRRRRPAHRASEPRPAEAREHPPRPARGGLVRGLRGAAAGTARVRGRPRAGDDRGGRRARAAAAARPRPPRAGRPLPADGRSAARRPHPDRGRARGRDRPLGRTDGRPADRPDPSRHSQRCAKVGVEDDRRRRAPQRRRAAGRRARGRARARRGEGRGVRVPAAAGGDRGVARLGRRRGVGGRRSRRAAVRRDLARAGAVRQVEPRHAAGTRGRASGPCVGERRAGVDRRPRLGPELPARLERAAGRAALRVLLPDPRHAPA